MGAPGGVLGLRVGNPREPRWGQPLPGGSVHEGYSKQELRGEEWGCRGFRGDALSMPRVLWVWGPNCFPPPHLPPLPSLLSTLSGWGRGGHGFCTFLTLCVWFFTHLQQGSGHAWGQGALTWGVEHLSRSWAVVVLVPH